jgi:hypothetical protein
MFHLWILIDYCFTSRSRIFHVYGDVTITGEGLQNFSLCSALRVFEQGGIFIVPRLLWHKASVFPVSSEGPPNSVASYETQGDVLRHTKGCGGPILTRILTEDLDGDVTITVEGKKILSLCSALRALEQGGIFIVPHLLWHRTSVFPVLSEGPPHLVASYDTRGDVEDL